MINQHIHAALACEPRTTLLALVQAVRPASRAAGGERVVLRDGSQVLIRPVQSADALLSDGFARLSVKSRRMRFLTPKKELSAVELRYFTDVDHHDHEALGALNCLDGRGVGIARRGYGILEYEIPLAAELELRAF